MSSSKPSLPKGTRDFGPIESAKRSYITNIIRKNFLKYGFDQIETPSMEQLSVLTGKYGDEGDQLIFKILNSGDFLKSTTSEDFQSGTSAMLPKIAEKGLRYDLTVPFARFVVSNQHLITLPFKRFQIQPVWRADRPQKGRYREFYQCDADVVGSTSLWNEAELTLLIHDVYQDLNYQGFLVKINHRELLMEMARFAGLVGQEMGFCVVVDKKDKIGSDQMISELVAMGALPDQLNQLMTLFEDHSATSEKLNKLKALIGENKGIEDLEKYFEYLNHDTTLQIELDFSLARGLSYYTGMIFEVAATDVAIGSINGGGRYDNLTGVFGLEGISGVGISFGLDRIYDVIEQKGLFPEHIQQSTDVLIVHFDEASFKHGIQLVRQLRQEGLSAEIYPDQAKMKKQMNFADKKQIPHVIIIGSEEISSETYSMKYMKTGEQVKLNMNGIINALKSTKLGS